MTLEPSIRRAWPGSIPLLLLALAACAAAACLVFLLGLSGRFATHTLLVPPPAEHVSGREPVYVECRNDQLYQVDMARFLREAERRVAAIAQQVGGDQQQMRAALAGPAARLADTFYEVDFSGGLAGEIALRPRAEAPPGEPVDDEEGLEGDGFLPRLLRQMGNQQRLKLLVRDDSYRSFKYAQRLALLARVETSVDVYSSGEAIVYSPLMQD